MHNSHSSPVFRTLHLPTSPPARFRVALIILLFINVVAPLKQGRPAVGLITAEHPAAGRQVVGVPPFPAARLRHGQRDGRAPAVGDHPSALPIEAEESPAAVEAGQRGALGILYELPDVRWARRHHEGTPIEQESQAGQE